MVLNDNELLHVLKTGIYTRLSKYDNELTHYYVIDFDDNNLLICYDKIDWRDGSTWYTPHIIKQKDKNKKWFFCNYFKEE